MPTRRRQTKPNAFSAESRKRVSVKIYGTEEDVVDEREVQVFEVEPAYVRVNAGVTRNLGNYESLRLDVAITMPCYQETIEETVEAVAEDVSYFLETEVEKYLRNSDDQA